MHFLIAIITGIFISNITFAFSNTIQTEKLSETQVAVGTYIYHDNIEQPMLITGDKNGSWSFVNLNLISNIENGGYFYSIICQENTCISTAAIETQPYYWPASHRRPFFMIGNKGQSWSAITDIEGLPEMTDGITPSISCADGLCIAAGWYQNNGNTFALLLRSNDNGQSWSYISNIAHLSLMTRSGALSAIHCNSNYCIAAGTSYIGINKTQLFLLVSDDGGQFWSYIQNIDGIPEIRTARLKTIKCHHTFCIAAGNYKDSKFGAHALLLVSKDKGKSWKFIKELPELTNLDDLFIQDLTYTNGSFIAVGGYRKKQDKGFLQSLILVSNNNGQSWTIVQDLAGPESEKLGWLKSISCIGNTCVSGGSRFYAKGGMLSGLTLLVSEDKGKSWLSIPYIAGTSYAPDIETVQCAGSKCTALGNYTDDRGYSRPAILISIDKAQTWTVVKNILDFPEKVYNVHFSSATVS